ncbi:hypothetical protein C8J56DRAFT_1038996 [Mycena floridula]|nr:hypothetical protein C8J56DRAFT_1052359 [Mycena floridula]KAJ7588796.1 hypothetical protein C8J56DRAFT_1049725 [Mycena floridula]KAJ7598207.1 hypothetical protein C8J56DRAFT_1038996 [Mycena floridula]
MFDKGKAPVSDTPPAAVSAQILMALMDRIDTLTAQVADLTIGRSAPDSARVSSEDEGKDEKSNDADAAENKSVDEDDDDTVVVAANPGQGSDVSGPSSSATPENPHFLTCPSCQHRFPPPPPRENWYVVTRGTQVGIFTDWNVVARHVVGVKGAVFKRYGTRTEAEAAFNAALANGFVQVIA